MNCLGRAMTMSSTVAMITKYNVRYRCKSISYCVHFSLELLSRVAKARVFQTISTGLPGVST